MSKQSGLGDNLYVAGYDLSGDIGSLSKIGGGIQTLDTTGIDKSAHERIGGQRDGSLEFTSFFNDAAGQEHPVLSALPTSDIGLLYARGTVLGNPAACMVAKQVGYDGNRADNGAFTFKVSALANSYGLEWGRLLTAGKRTDTTATNGSGVDTAASASFGGQAYLQVFSVAGTSVTVAIEDSADNISFAAVAGLAFTAATPGASPQTQRLAISNTSTIRRYVRAVTTGTFSNAVFAVVLVKNENAGVVF
jgi:hypothetical protein